MAPYHCFPGKDPRIVYEELLDATTIVDCHTHLGEDKDGMHQAMPELVRAMNKHKVDRAVAFPFNMPGPGRCFHNANEIIAKAYEGHKNRLIPFMRLDPHSPACGKEMQERLDQGFRGIKLHPRAQSFSIDEEIAFNIYEAAQDNDIPIIIHTGLMRRMRIGDALTSIIEDFPHLKIILAHGAYVDIVRVVYSLKGAHNILFDTSVAPIYDIYELIYSVGPDRVVYGSDMPYGHMASALEAVVDIALSLHLPKEKIDMIMGQNILGWVGP